jgi:predicted nucleic acid-binding protein
MIGLDTNVLLRLFVEHASEQAELARRLMSDVELRGEKVFVSPLVLAEFCWALRGPYKVEKADVLVALERSPTALFSRLATVKRWKPPLKHGARGKRISRII